MSSTPNDQITGPAMTNEQFRAFHAKYIVESGEPNAIPVPGLTYQNSPEGRIDRSHGGDWMTFGPDIRDRFEQMTREGYPRHPDAYERLQALLAEQLERLPENEFARRDAWLARITEDGGPSVAGWQARYERREQAERAERERVEAIRERARTTGERQELSHHMSDGCTNGNEDCSFDSITVYVNPDGTTTREAICCY